VREQHAAEQQASDEQRDVAAGAGQRTEHDRSSVVLRA
jgi:hypothetical protein